MSVPREKVHLFVSGLVQGVGFRAATRREANSLGLQGWVRNTCDLRVEIEAAGESDKIDRFLEWCGRGPRMARVEGVQVMERIPIARVDAASVAGFEIR